jgi:hypothetical protein
MSCLVVLSKLKHSLFTAHVLYSQGFLIPVLSMPLIPIPRSTLWLRSSSQISKWPTSDFISVTRTQNTPTTITTTIESNNHSRIHEPAFCHRRSSVTSSYHLSSILSGCEDSPTPRNACDAREATTNSTSNEPHPSTFPPKTSTQSPWRTPSTQMQAPSSSAATKPSSSSCKPT